METKPDFFYANGLEIAVSPYDFSLRLVRNAAPRGLAPQAEGVPTEEAALLVAMTPSHAKAMVAGLLAAVQEYEKRFGVLPLAPEQQSTWDQFFPGEKKP